MEYIDLWLKECHEASRMRTRIMELAEKGTISGQVAYYLIFGKHIFSNE